VTSLSGRYFAKHRLREAAMLMAIYVWATSRVAETLDERGATAAEYALLIALVAVVIAVAVTGLATRIGAALDSFVP